MMLNVHRNREDRFMRNRTQRYKGENHYNFAQPPAVTLYRVVSLTPQMRAQQPPLADKLCAGCLEIKSTLRSTELDSGGRGEEKGLFVPNMSARHLRTLIKPHIINGEEAHKKKKKRRDI